MSTSGNPCMPARLALLLEGLPDFEPDPGLWARIQAARARRQRRRRNAWLGGGLAAAAVLCVVLLGRDRLPSGSAGDLASWREQAQSLESQWRTMAADALDPRSRAELRLIDAELQSAYDRGAGDDELIPLWKLRSAALQDLIRGDNDRLRAATRI